LEAQVHRVDHVSGARLHGGEMLDWSDFAQRPSAGAVQVLLPSFQPSSDHPGRVLLLGPRAAGLVEELAAWSAVDVLVRGLPDARALGVATQLRAGVTLHCGSLDRFEPPGRFDLVVVLDGPETLLSPDGVAASHLAVLDRCRELLTDEGVLVAALANELGVDRLFALDVVGRQRDNSAWGWEAPGDAVRPPYLSELLRHLKETGNGTVALYSALPSASDVALLVRPDDLPADDAGRLAVLGTRVFTAAHRQRPALADPFETARHLLESGELALLAPGWVIVARRAGASLPTMPALVALETDIPADWRAVTVRDGDGWHVRSASGHPERQQGPVLRCLTPAAETVVSGPSLDVLLRRACHHHDLATVRHLVRRYDSWVRSPAEHETPEHRFFAVPSDVLVNGDRMASVDPSWRLTVPVADDVLVAHGLREFASGLLASGAEHPWSSDISPDALVRTLAAMAGNQVTDGTLDALSRLEAQVDAATGTADEGLAYLARVEAGRSQFVAQSGPARGYREAVAASIRLAQALESRSAKVEWLEATLESRDRKLEAVQQQLAHTRGSLSFRIGQLVTFPARAFVVLGRRIVNAVLPMDLVHKAETLARKLLERER
jgi:hypothetical protein